jgi:hypothetical protein
MGGWWTTEVGSQPAAVGVQMHKILTCGRLRRQLGHYLESRRIFCTTGMGKPFKPGG